jgi:hypothetical protein
MRYGGRGAGGRCGRTRTASDAVFPRRRAVRESATSFWMNGVVRWVAPARGPGSSGIARCRSARWEALGASAWAPFPCGCVHWPHWAASVRSNRRDRLHRLHRLDGVGCGRCGRAALTIRRRGVLLVGTDLGTSQACMVIDRGEHAIDADPVRLLVDRRCRSFVHSATFTLRVAAGSRGIAVDPFTATRSRPTSRRGPCCSYPLSRGRIEACRQCDLVPFQAWRDRPRGVNRLGFRPRRPEPQPSASREHGGRAM